MNSGIVALRKLSGAVLNNIFEFQFVLVGPAAFLKMSNDVFSSQTWRETGVPAEGGASQATDGRGVGRYTPSAKVRARARHPAEPTLPGAGAGTRVALALALGLLLLLPQLQLLLPRACRSGVPCTRTSSVARDRAEGKGVKVDPHAHDKKADDADDRDGLVMVQEGPGSGALGVTPEKKKKEEEAAAGEKRMSQHTAVRVPCTATSVRNRA